MATDSWNAGGRGTPGGGGKAARNDITGALIKTGVATDKYRNSPFWDSVKADKAAEEVTDGKL